LPRVGCKMRSCHSIFPLTSTKIQCVVWLRPICLFAWLPRLEFKCPPVHACPSSSDPRRPCPLFGLDGSSIWSYTEANGIESDPNAVRPSKIILTFCALLSRRHHKDGFKLNAGVWNTELLALLDMQKLKNNWHNGPAEGNFAWNKELELALRQTGSTSFENLDPNATFF
jgi:hypothetical protein